MTRMNTTDAGLLLIRVMLGVVFLYHGGQKMFGLFGGPGLEGFAGFLGQMNMPLPQVSAFLAAGAEFVGGLALLSGLFMRWAMIPVVITMLVASFKVHGSAFGLQQGGMEYALTLGITAAGLGLTGPGAWTLLALRPTTGDETEQPLEARSASA